MKKAKLAVMMVGGALLLTACDGGNEDDVRVFTIRDIVTASCETNAPTEINDTNFSSNENAESFNVNSTNPGCDLPGG
ncbi:MAG: hypothetical protein V4607_16920 [Pseudomonadota bacterium]